MSKLLYSWYNPTPLTYHSRRVNVPFIYYRNKIGDSGCVPTVSLMTTWVIHMNGVLDILLIDTSIVNGRR